MQYELVYCICLTEGKRKFLDILYQGLQEVMELVTLSLTVPCEIIRTRVYKVVARQE